MINTKTVCVSLSISKTITIMVEEGETLEEAVRKRVTLPHSLSAGWIEDELIVVES